MPKTSVMWFRRDLRLSDNSALQAAFSNSDSIILVFIIDKNQIEEKGSVNQSSFFASVDFFRAFLESNKINFYIFSEDIKSVFKKLKKEIPDWSDLFFNFDESGYGRKRDQEIVNYCREELNVLSHPFIDYTLHSALDIKKKDGSGYKVFTPYFKQWLKQQKKLPVANINICELEQKQNKTYIIDASKEVKKLIRDEDYYCYENKVGEEIAQKKLLDFVSNKLPYYDKNRDIPYLDGTSHLSRHLRTGEISIRTIYHAVIKEPESVSRDTFIKELCWRDYYNMIYTIYPDQQEKSIKKSFQNIKWENNEENFNAWKAGKTGFPIVDAAMRQLNETGWMHNRLRMIVASFLTKDLLIDWRWGETYFREKLIDYDPASNIGGWQWAASTGTDSVPYFRVFNPTIQSKKFDPDGKFIKKYVPELRYVKGQKIHNPHTLTSTEKTEYNINQLLNNYTYPIVDHKYARIRAISAYENSRE